MRLAAAMLLCLTLVAASGCLRPKPYPDRAARAGGPNAVAPNPFAPVSIRIHPLTRMLPMADESANEASIEAHLELLDAVGDSVKGAGELALELYREGGPASGVGEAGQVQRWSLNLSDLRVNADAYDRVTRTYRVILTGAPSLVRQRQGFALRARLTTPDGRQLSDEAELDWH